MTFDQQSYANSHDECWLFPNHIHTENALDLLAQVYALFFSSGDIIICPVRHSMGHILLIEKHNIYINCYTVSFILIYHQDADDW